MIAKCKLGFNRNNEVFYFGRVVVAESVGAMWRVTHPETPDIITMNDERFNEHFVKVISFEDVKVGKPKHWVERGEKFSDIKFVTKQKSKA